MMKGDHGQTNRLYNLNWGALDHAFRVNTHYSYSRKIFTAKIFAKPNYNQCSKGHHTLYAIITTGQKVCGTSDS